MIYKRSMYNCAVTTKSIRNGLLLWL